MNDKYVLVTAISTHRMRYAIPMDELQKFNEEHPVDPRWALDCVTCQEIEEFSQDHLGEQIVDYDVLTEEEILAQFDKDNDYLIDREVQRTKTYSGIDGISQQDQMVTESMGAITDRTH